MKINKLTKAELLVQLDKLTDAVRNRDANISRLERLLRSQADKLERMTFIEKENKLLKSTQADLIKEVIELEKEVNDLHDKRDHNFY